MAAGTSRCGARSACHTTTDASDKGDTHVRARATQCRSGNNGGLGYVRAGHVPQCHRERLLHADAGGRQLLHHHARVACQAGNDTGVLQRLLPRLGGACIGGSPDFSMSLKSTLKMKDILV